MVPLVDVERKFWVSHVLPRSDVASIWYPVKGRPPKLSGVDQLIFISFEVDDIIVGNAISLGTATVKHKKNGQQFGII